MHRSAARNRGQGVSKLNQVAGDNYGRGLTITNDENTL